jgi:predicted AAA+ superfamily ATPase
MIIAKNELTAILSQLNPWWRGEAHTDLPEWKRASFNELFRWVYSPPAPRAVLLSGARQVGKTTLLLQAIQALLKKEVPASNILYATFDHPLIKMAGIEAVLQAWREREPIAAGPEYLFLDEAQFINDWGTWVKHQVDFDFTKNKRIIFTGSAMPLIHAGQESGVGRWHTIKLTTLSFYEYLQLKEIPLPFTGKDFLKTFLNFNENFSKEKLKFEFIKQLESSFNVHKLPSLPDLSSIEDLFSWDQRQFQDTMELTKPYIAHFHQYLVRGGFPQTAQIENVTHAQQLIREDIIDKVLKRDMTALFGVRRVLDLEQTFLYLCMHDGSILDMPNLCNNLQVKRPTAQHFIELLEATHLIYRLQPFGYGKDILRAKFKIYLADAAIAPSVLLKGTSILDDSSALGVAIETSVFKHLFAHSAQHLRFTYWHGDKNHEVDLVMEDGNKIIPFEIKYRTQHTGVRDLKGLIELCRKKSVKYAYVITKSLNDFGVINNTNS